MTRRILYQIPAPGRKVWGYPDRTMESEFRIPNAAIFRGPWGVYVRTRRWRLRLGPWFRGCNGLERA